MHPACWGDNSVGQLGDGTQDGPRASPKLLAGLPGWRAASSADATCITQPHGEVYCWGRNDSGQVGNGTTASPVTTPTRVWGLACGDAPLPANGNLCVDDIGQSSTIDGICTLSSRPLPAGSLCNPNTTCKSPNRCDGNGNCTQSTTWCNDLNKCTTDSCDNSSDQCSHGNAADDHNECTSDSCDPNASSSGISHSPTPQGSSCSVSANPCIAATSCDGAGSCSIGTSVNVSDNNPCTLDACTSSTGITHTASALLAGVTCTNASGCINSTCDAAGTCTGRPIPVSTAGINPACVAQYSCAGPDGQPAQPYAPAGTICDDGNLCATSDACDGSGHCAGNAKTSNSTNPCTQYTCDATTGNMVLAMVARGTQCPGAQNYCDGSGHCTDSLGTVTASPVAPALNMLGDGSVADQTSFLFGPNGKESN